RGRRLRGYAVEVEQSRFAGMPDGARDLGGAHQQEDEPLQPGYDGEGHLGPLGAAPQRHWERDDAKREQHDPDRRWNRVLAAEPRAHVFDQDRVVQEQLAETHHDTSRAPTLRNTSSRSSLRRANDATRT